MTKEETILQKHILDLADQAWKRDIPTFTDFLTLHEQNIFHSIKSRLNFIHCRLYGGYEQAERQMLGFLPDAFCFDEETEKAVFPLSALAIRPLNAKFSEQLSHRDYLGSLMNLGVERSKMGDILIDEQGAILLCSRDMADYLSHELTRVRHTTVSCTPMEAAELHFTPRTEEITGSVASVRLDALLSAAFPGSRSTMTGYIEGGQTFVNGRQVLKSSYEPPEGAMISVRGCGRVCYKGVVGGTRKGRTVVLLEKYI